MDGSVRLTDKIMDAFKVGKYYFNSMKFILLNKMDGKKGDI